MRTKEDQNRRAAKYRAAHPDRVKASKAKYRAEHPERVAVESAARKEKRRSGLENSAVACSKWYAANQEAERSKRNAVRYGISPEEYAARVAQPCGICGHIEKVKKMHVDHDHETGRLRGTLCHECNTGLGLFDDSTPRLLSAIQYLARYA